GALCADRRADRRAAARGCPQHPAGSSRARGAAAGAVEMTTVDWSHARIKGRLPPRLTRCPGPDCGQYLYPSAKTCPHCGGTLVVLRKKQLAAIRKAEKAIATLRRILDSAE